MIRLAGVFAYPSVVRRMLNPTLMAPAVVERVLNGMEGDADALDRLVREAEVVWSEKESESIG